MNWRSTTLKFAVLVFIFQVAAGIALLGITGAVVRRQIERDAATRADTLREDLLITFRKGGLPALAQAVRVRTDQSIRPGAVLLVRDRRGNVVAGNLAADWPTKITARGGHALLSLTRTGHTTPEAMWVRTTVLPHGVRLMTGSVVEDEQRIIRYLEGSAVFVLSLAIVFAALAAALAARLIVVRLDATVATLKAVRDGDLGRRVKEDPSRDAFAALAKAVNMTLERIDNLVGELKIATDGLAHDLKSPLTRLQSALELATREAHEPVALAALDRARDEGDRLLAIVDTALRISRAEVGVGRDDFVPAGIASILADIAEIYGPVAEESDRYIEVEAPESIILHVHRELLVQALGNLVDNALKYGEGSITLRVNRSQGAVLIAVEDRGRGIAPSLRATALSRFGRLDEARQKTGAGLGLALVGAVVRLHGGTLVLTDADPGLSAQMILPLAQG